MKCDGLHCPGCGTGKTGIGSIAVTAAVIIVAAEHRAIGHYVSEAVRVAEITTLTVIGLALAFTILVVCYRLAIRPRIRNRIKASSQYAIVPPQSDSGLLTGTEIHSVAMRPAGQLLQAIGAGETASPVGTVVYEHIRTADGAYDE